MLATPTASNDSISMYETSSIEAAGFMRHCAIFSAKDRVASKYSGS